MKLLIILVSIAVAQTSPIEPKVRWEGGKTPFSERRYDTSAPFIVNGQPAQISQFPHMLALLDDNRKF